MTLGQTAFLILVIVHFATFLAVLAGTCVYTWLPSKRAAPKMRIGQATHA